MADGEVIINTKLDTAELERNAKSAKTTVNSLGEGMQSASKKSNSLDTGLGKITKSLKTLETIAKSSVIIKIAQKALGALSSCSAEAGVLTEKLKGASTLYGSVAVDQENLINSLYNISSQTGESLETLGQSVYDALSAGVEPTKDMGKVLKVVTSSAKLAKAGFTSTSTALSATLSVMNAYKLDMEELDTVQSMLLQTQNLGVTTVDELGSALAKVTPTAAAFGVGFADISASLALMTKQGTKTEVATTALSAVISELGKSGTTAAENLAKAAESAGKDEKSFKGLLSSGMSLGEILQLMSEYADKNGLSMVDMFSSIEAGRATLQLVGDNAQDYTDILGEMKGAAGLVQESFEKTVDPVEQLSAAWSNLKTRIGQDLQPALYTLASAGTSVLTAMTGQEVSADDLSSALTMLETASDNAKTAQEELKASLDDTTRSSFFEGQTALYTAIGQVATSYEKAAEQMKKYETASASATQTFAGNKRRAEEAMQQTGLTLEELYDRFLLWQAGVLDVTEVLYKGTEDYRTQLLESVGAYYETMQAAETAEAKVASWQETMEGYVATLADLVKTGSVSLTTLSLYSEDLARAVNKYLQTHTDSVAKTVEAVETVVEAKEDEVEEVGSAKNAYEEMEKEYKRVVDEQNALIARTNLLGIEKATEEDKLNALIDLYNDMYDKYGGNSYACLVLAGRIRELNTSIEDEKKKAEEAQKALEAKAKAEEDAAKAAEKAAEEARKAAEEERRRNQELVDLSNWMALDKEYENLINSTDALCNARATEEDRIEALNKRYIDLVDIYGEADGRCQQLKKRIDDLCESAKKGDGAWADFVDTLHNMDKSSATTAMKGIGSAIEEACYELLTMKETLAEIDGEIAEVQADEESAILAIETAQEELNTATAKGNAASIKSAEEKLANAQKELKALQDEKKALEANRKETASGADAWKSAGKIALQTLAEVLESVGAQLAAQAVVKAMTGMWASVAIATAGSVAAYAAAGAAKAAANKYETGGIVPGNSRHGDRVLARVNSGELILNTAQQDNLARLIEASASLAQSGASGVGIHVHFDGVSFYGLDEPAVGKAIYDNLKTLQYEGVI